jgi:engulfment/cell motility protein 1
MGAPLAVCSSAAPPSTLRLTLRSQVREELNHEALQFVKEQRIRCLLQGGWFPSGLDYSSGAGPVTSKTLSRAVPSAWRFVRLSHNRRYLHYADFDERTATEPRLDALQQKSKYYRLAQVACLRKRCG